MTRLLSVLGGLHTPLFFVLFGTAVVTTAYLAGRADGKAGCEVEALRDELHETRRLLSIQYRVQADARVRSFQDAAEISALREQLEDYADAQDATDSNCMLSADDARQLRDIR